MGCVGCQQLAVGLTHASLCGGEGGSLCCTNKATLSRMPTVAAGAAAVCQHHGSQHTAPGHCGLQPSRQLRGAGVWRAGDNSCTGLAVAGCWPRRAPSLMRVLRRAATPCSCCVASRFPPSRPMPVSATIADWVGWMDFHSLDGLRKCLKINNRTGEEQGLPPYPDTAVGSACVCLCGGAWEAAVETGTSGWVSIPNQSSLVGCVCKPTTPSLPACRACLPPTPSIHMHMRRLAQGHARACAAQRALRSDHP